MIDVDQLTRATAGDADLRDELLRLFQTQLGQAIETLNQPGRGTPATRGLDLHRLRGAALAVGAMPLADQLAAAEAGPDAGPANAGAVLADLREVLRKTADCAAAIIAAGERAGLAKRGEDG